MKRESSIINKPAAHKDHMPPKHYKYNEGYNQTNKCCSCNLVGLYEDLHQAGCCPRCGGTISRFGSGQWTTVDNVKQWVKNGNGQ